MQILNHFKCEKDSDVENFLKEKAIDFERLNKSRTYLIYDLDDLLVGRKNIIAYFSLAMKVLVIPENLSVRARKEIDGYRGKIHGNPIREVPCFLIGQLAKNSGVQSITISGEKILEEAFSVLNDVQDSIGGRYVMIECHNNEKLLKFYTNNGFYKFNYDCNDDMVQMLCRL